MAEIVQSADTQAEWQTGTLDGVEATSGGDLVLAQDYALSFDGVDDRVESSDVFSALTNFTVESWIYLDSVSGDRALIGKWNVSGQILIYHDDPSGWRVLAKDSSDNLCVSFQSSVVSTVGLWTHIAFVVDQTSNIKMYIDGVLSDQGGTVNGNPIKTNTAIFCISTDDDYSRGLIGNIKDVRIWNVARTQTEIQDNMNATLTGTEAGLVAYYPFTAGSGTTLTDHAGSNDGTINGATWVNNDGSAISLPITGTRTAPTLDLSTLGTASETSSISWQATDNSQTISIETALSTDGGTTWGAWQTATNGGSIPGITTGMDLSTAQLKCRQTLSTTDTTVTPQLHSLNITVRKQQAILSGIITEAGAPVARTVRAYRRDTGAMVGETTSASADGTFSMDVGVEVECYVVTLDDTSDATDYNAEIADRLVPGIL